MKTSELYQLYTDLFSDNKETLKRAIQKINRKNTNNEFENQTLIELLQNIQKYNPTLTIDLIKEAIEQQGLEGLEKIKDIEIKNRKIQKTQEQKLLSTQDINWSAPKPITNPSSTIVKI